MPSATHTSERASPEARANAADAVRAALVDLFRMPTPEDTLRRACAAFRDLLGARSCWIHGLPLYYDPLPGIPPPSDATYATDSSVRPETPPPCSATIGALYAAADAAAPDTPDRLLRRLRVNGEPWGILYVSEPSPAALADPWIQGLFSQLLEGVEGLLVHVTRGERLRASRTLIEQVAEELPGAVFLVNRNHRIVFLNKVTEHIAHMGRDQIIRDGCFGLFCDRKTRFDKCPGHSSLFTGKPWDGEVEIDGRHYQVFVRPLRVAGAIPYSLVVLDDQTESFRQRTLLNKTIDRISVLLDQSTRIRRCLTSFATTESASTILSIALREAVALFESPYTFLVRFQPDGTLVRIRGEFSEPASDIAFLTPEARGRIARHFNGANELLYRRGQAENHDDNIERMLEISGASSAFFAAIWLNGRIWGYLGSLSNSADPINLSDLEARRDIVNLVEIAVHRASMADAIADREKALVEAAEKARASARAKTLFLATMSHEIRTPLNAIIGFAEALGRSGGLSPDARGYSEGINRSAIALLDLLNDILDLAKLESSNATMRAGQCDLAAISREIATIFRYSAGARGVELRDSVPDNLPILRLDGPRIRQILLNLVGNAVKFTMRGHVEWSASCTPAAAGDGAVSLAIDVADTGIGIPPDRLETIFDPFVQVGGWRPDARANQKGTGLGLSIVKRLVEACGGTISVESEPGKGSRFSIRIENVDVVAAPAPDSSSAQAAEGSRSPRPPEPCGHALASLGEGFTPLIVDDIPLNIDILALHFNALGVLHALRATSGAEALEMIRREHPSIVLTDLWMPEMDGEKLARAIRGDPALKDIPVVAVTADSDVAASFDDSIFDAILVKPVTSERLADCMARLAPHRKE